MKLKGVRRVMKRRRTMVMLTLLLWVGWGPSLAIALPPAGAESAPGAVPGCAAPAPAAAVTLEDVATALGIITKFHHAYESRDLESIIALAREFIRRKGLVYRQSHPDLTAAQAEAAYEDAFRGTNQQVLESVDYALEPLDCSSFSVAVQDGRIVIAAAKPMIATSSVPIGEGKLGRFKYSRFTFERIQGAWTIVDLGL